MPRGPSTPQQENHVEETKQERPELMVGTTYKVKAHLPGGDSLAVYITINSIDGGPTGIQPWEVFLNCRQGRFWEHFALVAVMLSRQLQAGIPVETIAGDLMHIQSPETGHMAPGGYAPSIYARIGKVLLREAGAKEKPRQPPVLVPGERTE